VRKSLQRDDDMMSRRFEDPKTWKRLAKKLRKPGVKA